MNLAKVIALPSPRRVELWHFRVEGPNGDLLVELLRGHDDYTYRTYHRGEWFKNPTRNKDLGVLRAEVFGKLMCKDDVVRVEKVPL